MKNTPKLSKRAFWDINFNELDFDKHADFIITRVFNFGKWDDIIAVSSTYGKKKVSEVLVNAEGLNENTLLLASTLFDINQKNFKCYTRTQSRLSLKKRS